MIQDTFDIYFHPLLLGKLETTTVTLPSVRVLLAIPFVPCFSCQNVWGWCSILEDRGKGFQGASKTDATGEYWGESPLQDLRQHAKHRHSAISFVCKKPRWKYVCNLKFGQSWKTEEITTRPSRPSNYTSRFDLRCCFVMQPCIAMDVLTLSSELPSIEESGMAFSGHVTDLIHGSDLAIPVSARAESWQGKHNSWRVLAVYFPLLQD